MVYLILLVTNSLFRTIHHFLQKIINTISKLPLHQYSFYNSLKTF